jgi:acetoin:2,6-dichlorophenolindophenol oxidoreductase subunit alpha
MMIRFLKLYLREKRFNIQGGKKMDNNKLKKLYETMLRERLFVNEQIRQNNRGYIRGYLHCYNGEEAIAAGVCSDLDNNDSVFSTHRAEGHLIAMGADFKKIMAECFGKKGGYCYGMGGPMHMSAPDIGLIHSNGVVGGGIGLAVGAAFTHKYKEDRGVAISFFGDGASNQGILYEGMNLASIWDLPVVFVLENNQYASSSSVKEMIAIENIADRAKGFSMPGYTINGNDVLEVYETSSKAIERARDGEGPTFIECKTYRTRGHNEADPQWYYRSKEEVKKWEEECPIKKMKKYLIDNELMTEEEDKKLNDEIKQELEEAVEFAKGSPLPEEEYIVKYVWKEA